jgi:hypothetical protein
VAFIWVVIFPVALALVDGGLIAFTIVLWACPYLPRIKTLEPQGTKIQFLTPALDGGVDFLHDCLNKRLHLFRWVLRLTRLQLFLRQICVVQETEIHNS